MQVLEREGGVAEEGASGMNDIGAAFDDQGSRSCDMGGMAIRHLEVFRLIQVHFDIDGDRLGPFEVRECTVDVLPAISKPEIGPKRRAGCESEAPMPTDVSGCDEVQLIAAVFQYV